MLNPSNLVLRFKLDTSLQLGMPLGNERFAEVFCARLGIRRNAGRRGRPVMSAEIANTPTLVATGQGNFGF